MRRPVSPVSPTRWFTNPIIAGFHPDPSVCRLGRDFYLVTSSFEYFPGVPIFHSRDLVTWKQIGHVLTRESQLDLRRVRSSGGIYAPTIRHGNGRFYVITTNVDGGGNFFVTAKRPEGPWSDPIWLDREGIDPSLLFADGRVYYTRNGKGPDRDHPVIYQTTINVKTGKLSRKPTVIWSGLGGIWSEAPHLYKIDECYYLLTSEGGTGYDHSVVVARSPSPEGPFESCPGNPVLTHRDRRGHPIQATGHGDLIALPDGSWWMFFLGVRPSPGRADRGRANGKGGDGRHHHLGRETFLAPVTWTNDGWPVVGNAGRVELKMHAPHLKPTPIKKVDSRDDFDVPTLAPIWNFLRNPRARDWSLVDRPGHLRLIGSSITLDNVDSPALILRRQQHFNVLCRASLDFSPRRVNEEAGLTVRANENFHYDLTVTAAPTQPRHSPRDRSRSQGRSGADRQVLLRARMHGMKRVIARVRIAEDGPLHLRIDATKHWYVFSAGTAVGTGVRMHRLGKLSTRALSSESIWAFGQNCFTGAFFGVFATGNGRRSTVPADFDWFDYLPSP